MYQRNYIVRFFTIRYLHRLLVDRDRLAGALTSNRDIYNQCEKNTILRIMAASLVGILAVAASARGYPGRLCLPAMQRHGRAGLEKGVLEREFHVAVGSAK